ncbi:MAG: HAD family hydrolase [Christensenellales bacterium]|jgi:beta-phosphoglucomutase
MIKAVIFDMDGLLFDTEPIGVKATMDAAKKQGFNMSRSDALKTLGQTQERSLEILKNLLPGVDLEKYDKDYAECLDGATRHSVPLKPYAKEALEKAKEYGLLCGICSSNSKTRIDRYLKLSGLENSFDAIVSGDDGAKSKPAPDMFILCADKLNVAPNSCLVFEDSPAGLEAAHRADMLVYMVPDLVPYSKKYASFIDGVLQSLKEAPALYGKL